jgi:hypothetical protein
VALQFSTGLQAASEVVEEGLQISGMYSPDVETVDDLKGRSKNTGGSVAHPCPIGWCRAGYDNATGVGADSNPYTVSSFSYGQGSEWPPGEFHNGDLFTVLSVDIPHEVIRAIPFGFGAGLEDLSTWFSQGG